MKQTGDTSANFLRMIDNCKPIAYNHRSIYRAGEAQAQSLNII